MMGNQQLSPGGLFANRFEIQRAAGSGGMGTVYRAIDRFSGNAVALKLLHAGSGAPDETERFSREAQLLSELRHPGIVTYVAHGQTPDGQRFLAMEWLDGHDLGYRLEQGPLPVPDCIRILEQVADALSIAHGQGIIHRDLKPTNLFLVGGDLGRLKVLDFGIARRLRGAQALTQTGVIVGTPEYMAPEQVRGARALTPAADLFSLGCVLYQCLTGQQPFAADHVAAVLVRILFDDPPPLGDRGPAVPASLLTLLDRLLAKDPSLRVPDAAALRASLLALGEVSEPNPATTIAATGSRRDRFADEEQDLFSIVLAAPDEEVLALENTQARDTPDPLTTDQQTLPRAIEKLGATTEVLADGTLVVTVPPLGSAQDQAILAARAALLVKERWPQASVSMATGRGTGRGRTAIGEVVELAARLLKRQSSPSRPAASVAIDPLSARLLADRFAQTPYPGGALLLYEEREVDASRPLLGKPTPCVGREAELGALEILFRSCVEESQASVAVILAPPGIGKSRLRHEFLRRLQQHNEPFTVLLGRGDLTSAGTPYGILGQAVRRLCELESGDDKEAMREALRNRLKQTVGEAECGRIAMFVGEIAGVTFPEEGAPALRSARQNPRQMRDCVREAFLDWVRAECTAGPVLLVLDDLQWGDELSVGLIDELLHAMRELPFFVLALGRPELPEVLPNLWQAHRPQLIPLKALSKKAAERLVHHVLGKGVSAQVMNRILEQSNGNALFLEELIRSATAGNAAGPTDTILAMLQARIGRLDPGPRRALLAASVFGECFWLGGLAMLLGAKDLPGELERSVEALIQLELIEPHRRSRLADQPEYRFHHALVRDAAYALLTETDRVTGHLRAGQFLEPAGEQDSAMIAEHFERGNDPNKASEHYLLAGERAVRLCAYTDARKYFTGALAALKTMTPTNEVKRRRIDTLLIQVRASHISDQPRQNLERLAEATELIEGLASSSDTNEDILRRAWIYYWRGRIHYYTDEMRESLRYHEQLLTIPQARDHKELLLLATSASGTALYAQGRVDLALPRLESTIATMAAMGQSYEWVRAVGHRGLCLIGLGQHDHGMAELTRAHERALEIGQLIIISMTHLYYSVGCMHSGNWPLMLDRAQKGLDSAKQCGEKIYYAIGLGFIAWAQNLLGYPEDALKHYENMQSLAHEMGGHLLYGLRFAAAHSEMHLNFGQPERAIALAKRVISASIADDSYNSWGIAERVLATALHRLEPASIAEIDSHMAASLQAFARGGLVLDMARTRLYWALLCRQRGDLERGERLFREAAAQFQTSNCTYARDAANAAWQGLEVGGADR